ncbi:unnamed protein product [Closterium sp. NIES-54]
MTEARGAVPNQLTAVDFSSVLHRLPPTSPNQLRPFLRPAAEAREEGGLQEGSHLPAVIKAVQPHVLFGLSGKHHLFHLSPTPNPGPDDRSAGSRTQPATALPAAGSRGTGGGGAAGGGAPGSGDQGSAATRAVWAVGQAPPVPSLSHPQPRA